MPCTAGCNRGRIQSHPAAYKPLCDRCTSFFLPSFHSAFSARGARNRDSISPAWEAPDDGKTPFLGGSALNAASDSAEMQTDQGSGRLHLSAATTNSVRVWRFSHLQISILLPAQGLTILDRTGLSGALRHTAWIFVGRTIFLTAPYWMRSGVDRSRLSPSVLCQAFCSLRSPRELSICTKGS